MGLDMYLGKINKKISDNNEIDMLFKVKNQLENGFDNIYLINENKLEELVKNVFVEEFYKDYITLKDASDEILDEVYEDAYVGINAVRLKDAELTTKRDRLKYINELIKDYCDTLKSQYDYCNKNKDLISTLEVSELGYFRKHADLHGYFEELYYSRNGKDEFNCVKLILSKEDIEDVIEMAQKEIEGESVVNKAHGFFWGESSIDLWEYTEKVFKEILETTNFETETVYYDSWW